MFSYLMLGFSISERDTIYPITPYFTRAPSFCLMSMNFSVFAESMCIVKYYMFKYYFPLTRSDLLKG